MELGISLQLYQATSAWLLGFVIGISYDMLRAFRLRTRRRSVSIFLDLLFSVALIALFFFQGMYLGRGSLRIFMIFANVLGAIVYFKVLSAYILSAFTKILDKMLKIIQFIWEPIRKICAKGRKVYIIQKKAFHKWMKQYIIRDNIRLFSAGKKRKEGASDENQKG